MANIRSDVVGTVMAVNAATDYVLLVAGQEIPSGFWVGGHLVQGGDPDDQSPPWVSVDGAVAWEDISGKPAFIAAGETQAAARGVIGAGTSSIQLGTTAGTALAGNGVAASATKLATARTISVTGAVTGSASFDGTANAAIETTSGV